MKRLACIVYPMRALFMLDGGVGGQGVGWIARQFLSSVVD